MNDAIHTDAGHESLTRIVELFTEGLIEADLRRPVWTSRTGRQYGAGIGPHPEDSVVDLVLAARPELGRRSSVRVLYPDQRTRCDLVVRDPILGSETWVEIKMARFAGDNGKADDTALKDVLSPYSVDRSALTDCSKILSAPSDYRAIIIYGFDFLPNKGVLPVIEAFELLARERVHLGPRIDCEFRELVHPVHQSGRVCGWLVAPK